MVGLGEARNRLKDFLQAQGYDSHEGGMRNLASTGRLNLILKQNASMAHAAAEWKRMHDPDAMKVYPYVRYHARGDSRTRSEHAELDGRIFRKDDPFLSTHTPPWEFNCRCYLEEITEKEAGKTPDLIQEMTPPEKVTVDSKSGFSFDPAHAFEKFDLGSIEDVKLRASTHAGLLNFCKKGGCHFQMMTDPKKLSGQGICEPDNIDEIKRVISEVNRDLDAGINPRDIKDKTISLGKILPEHRNIGLAEDEQDIVFHTQGGQDHGTKHWIKKHRETLRPEPFLDLLRKTIWNPAAKCIEDINGTTRRLVFEYSDEKGNVIATVFELGEPGAKEWALVDAWEPDTRYLLAQERKRKNRGGRRS